MSLPEDRLAELGLVLPEPLQLPPGVVLPFPCVRIAGTRAIISGHGRTNTDGSPAQPLGKVGAEVDEEQAYLAARLTGLAILGSLRRELGSLGRITQWTRISGMADSAPGFARQPAVINGFTDLIVSAVGLADCRFASPSKLKAKLRSGVVMPDRSLQRGPKGGPPSPVWRAADPFCRPGLGVPSSVPA